MSLPEQVELESAVCPMDCKPSDKAVLKGSDRLHNLLGEFEVVTCQSCGLMRTNPRPTAETIGYYYPENYGPYQGTKVSVADQNNKPSLMARFAKRFIRFNTECIPESLKGGRMLEVGCASGRYLHKMAQQGWRVEGIEFSEEAADSARLLGYSIKTGSLETVDDYAEPFDLITGWMVVEHLHKPVEALKRLAGWTKPNGWIAISVPNAHSIEFKIFKDRWHALQLPTHLYHFTPESIEKVLDASGWQLKKIHHQRMLGSQFESLGYVVGERFPNGRLHQFLSGISEKGVLWNVAVYPLAWLLSLFGQTGRMTIWAQKK